MARLLPEDFSPEELNIEIAEVFPNCTEIFYLPSIGELKTAGIDSSEPSQHRRKIALFNGQDHFISVCPIFTLTTHPEYLGQKYSKISEISVELDIDTAPYTKSEVVELLERLPAGFIKDIRYGLGLTKEYRAIISAIEDLTAYHYFTIGNEKTGDMDSGGFNLNWHDYDEMRRTCNRITERARRVARITKAAATYNYIAYRLGVEQKLLPNDNDTISKMLRIKITDTDKQAAMSMVTEDKSAVKQTDSVTLAKLKNNIELVSLERLIATYEDLLSKHTYDL
ncbi:MAG: hypothetical protein ACK4GU_10460 [Alishewanella aestuarii]